MSLNRKTYLVFTVMAAVWCALIVAAPLLHNGGWQTVSDATYRLFGRICHQLDARSFHVGGAKFAVCHRCTAIYFSFFLTLLLMPMLRRLNDLAVPGRLWIALLLPMVADAVLNDLGMWTSTMISRLVTGSMAGLVLPWFVVPVLCEAIRQLVDHSSRSERRVYVRETE